MISMQKDLYWHMLFKLKNEWQRILKVAIVGGGGWRGDRNSIRLSLDFPGESLQDRKEWKEIYKIFREEP